VFLSLFEALSFTPMRSSLYREDKKDNKKKTYLFSVFSADMRESWNRWISRISVFKRMDPIIERFLDYSTDLYARSIDFVLKYPKSILYGANALFLVSLRFFFLLKKDFISPQVMGRFIVSARLPLGSSLQ
ncbi:efflux RND transporter permease subunit, partial [Leptospira interrogans serovar Pomona]|nr:efflux RND transporter permease subunit [Leptospira interrogans serovar Pomona]